MKITYLINSALIVVTTISLTSGIASAQSMTNGNEEVKTATRSQILSDNSPNASYLQPFNLVSLAYQGGLTQQGIPSGGTLIAERQNRKVNGESLVKAAVQANKLPEQVLSDRSYINAVNVQLTSLSREFSF
ncbi:hypothetical protein I8752_33550 [Nostocaceae cyanobacterium CENA369]|uniref:TolC family protein n=1 Tax=Dendronalium phyllosphericum CENA369 TaxID=1725256 RepID=A0A8J7IDT9_9NOST|nr:hypothetical protein [Dendronalium phyllosphericum]MBH8577803.1 hypothetical protein [Dendronalium phyllosphericum CENA369]